MPIKLGRHKSHSNTLTWSSPTEVWFQLYLFALLLESLVGLHVILTQVRVRTRSNLRRERTGKFFTLDSQLKCLRDPWNLTRLIWGPSIFEPCFLRYGSRWTPNIVLFMREEVWVMLKEEWEHLCPTHCLSHYWSLQLQNLRDTWP
jgi:hypothetical protein